MPKSSSDTKVWDKLRKRVAKAGTMHVKVGILQGKGAEEAYEGGLTLAEVAAVHELGGKHVPERSFIRRTVKQKKAEFKAKYKKLSEKLVRQSSIDTLAVLDLLGAFAAAEIRKTITTGEHIPPPLQPETVARKGSTRPLVHTGRLSQSINWKVEK